MDDEAERPRDPGSALIVARGLATAIAGKLEIAVPTLIRPRWTDRMHPSGSLCSIMDRQTAFLLALGLLILAAAIVSVTGWILFVRDRRASRAPRGAELGPPVDRRSNV